MLRGREGRGKGGGREESDGRAEEEAVPTMR